MSNNLNNREFLILGGSGTLGNALTKVIFEEYKPRGVRIFSRGELLQWKMKKYMESIGIKFGISFLIGDIRDKERVWRAMQGVDIVINAAAMKRIDACEENPLEAIKTNIDGCKNIIEASLDTKVEKVMFVSSDKSVSPTNLYGATKMAGEKLFIKANTYSGGRNPIFSCCRYGNVLGSRGSVIPIFREQAKQGIIYLTHPLMSRFWILIKDVAKFLLSSIDMMEGKEIFIPKMKVAYVSEIAKVIAPDAKIKIMGIREGEKLHEILITKEESKYVTKLSDRFILKSLKIENEPFEYCSNPKKNKNILSDNELKNLINQVE